MYSLNLQVENAKSLKEVLSKLNIDYFISFLIVNYTLIYRLYLIKATQTQSSRPNIKDYPLDI